MKISTSVSNIMRYLLEAMARVFSPNDDMYPIIGIQPFEGDPYKETKWAD